MNVSSNAESTSICILFNFSFAEIFIFDVSKITYLSPQHITPLDPFTTIIWNGEVFANKGLPDVHTVKVKVSKDAAVLVRLVGCIKGYGLGRIDQAAQPFCCSHLGLSLAVREGNSETAQADLRIIMYQVFVLQFGGLICAQNYRSRQL